MYPNAKITHEFAEEQTGYYSGRLVYENGKQIEKTIFDADSKEAYEMSSELWGSEDYYTFDESKGTYVYKEDDEEEME